MQTELRSFRPSYKISVVIAILLAITIIGLAYSYFIEPNKLVVRHEQLAVNGWNKAFDGFRIVMIADIHGGSNGGSAENIRSVVAAANAEDADVVVLLGDYVSEDQSGRLKMPMSDIADAMSGLKARYGVFAVMGNHDWRYGDEGVERELSRVGYSVLKNDIVTIEKNGQKLRLLGLKDHMYLGNWKDFSDAAKQVVAPSEGTGDLIVLEHSPDILPTVTNELAISNDLKLVLCAHTHGGQVWLPILGRPVIPSSYGQKYAYGHIFDRGVDMWVTSGTGTSVLPFRFMVPPEIVVLTVRSGA